MKTENRLDSNDMKKVNLKEPAIRERAVRETVVKDAVIREAPSEERNGKMGKKLSTLQFALFMAVLVGGMILGALLFLRPTVSVKEKRELTAFPEARAEELPDSEFWSQISTWYADTFPFRDTWIEINHRIRNLYGLQTMKVTEGEKKIADAIPDLPASSSSETEKSDPAAPTDSSEPADMTEKDPPSGTEEQTESSESTKSLDLTESAGSSAVENSASETPSNKGAEESFVLPELPDDPDAIAEDMENHLVEDLFVYEDAAYPLYKFNLDLATSYIGTMNRLASELEGETEVYNMIIPNSTQLMLPEDIFAKLGCSNEDQAIGYYYGMMSDKVHKLETYSTLKGHRDEYLYFRTDHHWTQTAAYLIYQNFAAEKGIKAHELSDYVYKKYEPFFGSYYMKCGTDAMKANPDYVETWRSPVTNSAHCLGEEGDEWDGYVVYDSDWDSGMQYVRFIGGDNPLETIENPELSDGSAVVIVKESFGNCFVPFLVDHYQYVYVIDYRYFDGSIVQFVRDHGAEDLIIANNLHMLANDYVCRILDQKLQ